MIVERQSYCGGSGVGERGGQLGSFLGMLAYSSGNVGLVPINRKEISDASQLFTA